MLYGWISAVYFALQNTCFASFLHTINYNIKPSQSQIKFFMSQRTCFKNFTKVFTEEIKTVLHSCCPTGKFEKGVAEGEVDASFGPLEALRLSVLTDSPVWVILSEVQYTITIHHLLLTHYKPMTGHNLATLSNRLTVHLKVKVHFTRFAYYLIYNHSSIVIWFFWSYGWLCVLKNPN